MNPYDQQGRQTEQSIQGGRQTPPGETAPPPSETGSPPASGAPAQQPAPPTPIREMDVDSPTLRWVSIEHPSEAVALGPDDYVLESVFNPGLDAWEVLVLVQPREDEETEDDE